MAKGCSSDIYQALGPRQIRLLRLLPDDDDEHAPLQCCLHTITLGDDKSLRDPFEALSYVWGGEEKPRSISARLGNAGKAEGIPITDNLHKALLRFRSRFSDRMLWIDAVCIDQESDREKEKQIGLMPEIYARAKRVVVWLGEGADDSDGALEQVRSAAFGPTGGWDEFNPLSSPPPEAVVALLRRPWFERIWVLQEVSAARHVSVVCGTKEMNEFTFVQGTSTLLKRHGFDAKIKSLISSVNYLMRDATRKPEYLESSSLGVCSLGELVDMYHTHKAGMRHDKVYALLGMSSGPEHRRLPIEYGISWRELFRRLLQALFPLSKPERIVTYDDQEVARMTAKAYVFGQVVSVRTFSSGDGLLALDVALRLAPDGSDNPPTAGPPVAWQVHASAKSPRAGDLVCLLREASRLMIIRPFLDFFAIIRVTVHAAEGTVPAGHDIFDRDISLLWDWTDEQATEVSDYQTRLRLDSQEIEIARPTRMWDVALAMGDGRHPAAEGSLRRAMRAYEALHKVRGSFPRESTYYDLWDGLTRLAWAAGNGYAQLVGQILNDEETDPNLVDHKYGCTPLIWAAEMGHTQVVELLVASDRVQVDKVDRIGRSPLSWAIERGHILIVECLIGKGKASVHIVVNGQTPLLWATRWGHLDIIRLIIEDGKASNQLHDRRLLTEATKLGHTQVVKLLIETGGVDVNAKTLGRTPLGHALDQHRDEVVQLLLDTGEIDFDLEDQNGHTAVYYAAQSGNDAFFAFVIAAGPEFDLDAKDDGGRTPLSHAAQFGRASVVEKLLGTGRVDADSVDNRRRTPLFWAAINGHIKVVSLLIATGEVDVNVRDDRGATPLSEASMVGRTPVAALLVAAGARDT